MPILGTNMFLSIANKKCNRNNTDSEGKTLFITRFDEQSSLRLPL